jgi:hypothetical protein
MAQSKRNSGSTSSTRKKFKPGDKVVLATLPPGLLRGLPREDQKAIRDILGKPVLLEQYDDDGRAVLTFTDSKNVAHSIFVSPEFMTTIRVSPLVR